MKYDLEIQRIIKEIDRGGHETVLLQFPSGLKPRAVSVAENIREATGSKVMVWAGSNYGACDLPGFEADLVVNFGHSRMK